MHRREAEHRSVVGQSTPGIVPPSGPDGQEADSDTDRVYGPELLVGSVPWWWVPYPLDPGVGESNDVDTAFRPACVASEATGRRTGFPGRSPDGEMMVCSP